MIKFYQQNTLTGEVIWIGKSALFYMPEECDFLYELENIAPEIEDEKYIYVLMKVKVDAKES